MTGAKKEERREKSAESCQGAHGVTRPTSPLSPLPSPLSRRGQGRFLTTALALLFIGPLSSSRCAETNEQQLIRLLMSDASAQAKDAACARLKRIGTASSVPALSAFLLNENLSHSARYALESMPTAAAGRALVNALKQSAGLTRIGIINSLGVRREVEAVPELANVLAEAQRPARVVQGQRPDMAAASGAAAALGQIASPQALEALQSALQELGKSEGGGQPDLRPLPSDLLPGKLHDALVDALLRCANHLLVSGSDSKAFALFQRLYETEEPDHVRLAAYRGMVQASGTSGLELMNKAIAGQPGPSQTSALQLVHDMNVPGATRAFVELLPKVAPPIQVALLGGLSQREDPAAAPAVAALVSSSDSEVRLAAITALGILGDASSIPLLAQSAASASGTEQTAARQALLELRRGDVTAMFLTSLATAQPALQAELARALGDRGDVRAVPKLLELARQPADSARKTALEALAELADQSQLGLLVQLVTEAQSEDARSEAANAVRSACRHIQSRQGAVDAQPLLKGLATGSAAARIALLPNCSLLIDPQVRAALRNALEDKDTQVHTAAIRALCDTSDAELLPDLSKLAREAQQQTFRTLAIGSCVRMLTQEETVKLSNSQRVEALKSILQTSVGPEQKRLLLAGLAEVPDLQALKLVEPLLDDAAVQAEAVQAAIKIAAGLSGEPARAATSTLKKALAVTSDAATRQPVEATLRQLEATADFITAWQVAGPYREPGKDFSALFEVAFPPEVRDAPGVNWRTLPASADAARPWVMDLLKALGGQQCVAYARTWVHCSQQQTALLEIGSDDGAKVWLNDQLVHSNNIARPLQPGSDKVQVTLRQGWNRLLLKITQNNQGWEFCARLRQPDGSHLDGLQFDAAAKNPSPAARQ